MRFLTPILAMLSLTVVANAAEGKLVPLWPVSFLGENVKPDVFEPRDINDVHAISITCPSMEIFLAPAENNTGAAVVICPGGGYNILSYIKEGTEIAEFFNKNGVNAIVLRYRVPVKPVDGVRGKIPLQDAQRALSLVRKNATDWKIDPARVGIMGFSAGGNLSALTANAPERAYPAQDDADKLDCKPNFTILIYPAWLLNDTETALRPEFAVTEKTPPAICVHAADDPISYKSSLVYFEALRAKKIPAEVLIYTTGGHGYGMRNSEPAKTWPNAVIAWLDAVKFLAPKK